MEKPLLSIIVPIYNIMEYLPRCVHSITAQTYENLEILLVDDGSCDGTGKLCDELAGEDARIRVFHKENGGSSSARNLAIGEARGLYLGFVDSDDYIEPDMYACLYEAIEKYSAKKKVMIAQIGRDEIDEKGNLLPNICEPPTEAEWIPSVNFMRELLMHRGDCSFCTKLVHRDLFAVGNFPVGKLNEDFYLLTHMLPECEGVISLPKQAYHVFYRMGSNSRKVEKENFSRVFGDSVDNADMVAELVKEKFPEDAELARIAFRFGVFQRLEYLLHIPISRMKKDGDDAVSVQYCEVVRWMRRNWWKSMGNRHLGLKNKVYHTLFAVAPRGVRVVHARLKGL